MLQRFTSAEMLRYWKRRLGLLADGTITDEEDFSELDLKLVDDIRSWYADLLQSAPIGLLPIENLALETTVSAVGPNCVQVAIPERATRFVSVQLEGWAYHVDRVVPSNSHRAALQRVEIGRATADRPVVVEGAHSLYLYGLPAVETAVSPEARISGGVTGGGSGLADGAERPLPVLKSLLMVAFPKDGTYVLDPGLLRHSELLIS